MKICRHPGRSPSGIGSPDTDGAGGVGLTVVEVLVGELVGTLVLDVVVATVEVGAGGLVVEGVVVAGWVVAGGWVVLGGCVVTGGDVVVVVS